MPSDTFYPFELERYQNKWENRVSYNLAESGVLPLTLGELTELTETDQSDFHALRLGYGQTDGSDELKESVASMYPGATPDNVLITVGSSEANFVTSWSCIRPGMRVAVQTPTYKQIWGLATNLGARVVGFPLLAERDWTLDMDEACRTITSETQAVVVTDPNNPTGYVLNADERKAILELTESAGAWLVADEVYRGAEHDNQLTESFWGSSDRAIVIGGLSKAYGLPGLRIGWVVAPASFVAEAAARHDYTVIGASTVSDFLAIRALAKRDLLLDRARTIVRSHFRVLEEWFSQHSDMFSCTPPLCGAICFPRYHMNIDSFALVEQLRRDHNVLLVPGSHFDAGRHLRVGFGYDLTALREALNRVGEAVTALAA